MRLVIIVLLLSAPVILSARGRARGYQAGGGIHRAQPKVHAKKAKPKPKTPTPAPEREATPHF